MKLNTDSTMDIIMDIIMEAITATTMGTMGGRAALERPWFGLLMVTWRWATCKAPCQRGQIWGDFRVSGWIVIRPQKIRDFVTLIFQPFYSLLISDVPTRIKYKRSILVYILDLIEVKYASIMISENWHKEYIIN